MVFITDDEKYIILMVTIVVVILTGSLLGSNYWETRQCDILSQGGTDTQIESFFLVKKKCYVALPSGAVINADNYRGMAE